MERYLGGEDIDADAAGRRTSRRAVARGTFHPVVPVDSATGVGCPRAARPRRRRLPVTARAPAARGVHAGRAGAARTLTLRPGGPLVAEVVKTTSDPYVGRVSLVRVFSGTLRPDATVHVSGHFASFSGAQAVGGHEDHDEDERIGSLSVPARQDAAARRTGSSPATLRDRPAEPRRDRRHPLRQGQPAACSGRGRCPSRCCRSRSRRRAKADEDKLGQALARLAAEDPTLRVEHNPETHQIVLWTHGRGARRRGARPARAPVRRRGRPGRAAGAAARDVRRAGQRARPARQAVRRPRAVRRVRHRGRAAARGRRASSSSTRWSAARCRGSSSPRSRRACAPRWSAGSRAGYPVVDLRVTLHRRQGAQRRLLRHGLPDGRRRWRCGRPPRRRGRACSSRSTRSRSSCPTTCRRGDERPVGAARPGARHRPGRATTGTLVRAEVPQTELVRYAVDLRAVHPRRRRRSPAPSRATSRCPRTSPSASSTLAELQRRRGSAGWIASSGARREVRLAVADQLVVRRLAHQRDQLGPVGDVDRLRRDVRLGVARAVPVQVVAARAPAAAVVLADGDLGVRRAVGPLDVAEGTPDRQLPAHVRLGLERVHALAQRQAVQGAARAAGEAAAGSGRCRRPRATAVLRSPSSSVSTQPRFLRACRVVELPGLRRRARSTQSATRFSSSLSEKCAPSVQQPSSGRSA